MRCVFESKPTPIPLSSTTTTTLHSLFFLISWHGFLSAAGYRVYCVNDCRMARLNFEPCRGPSDSLSLLAAGETGTAIRERYRLGVNPFIIGIVKIPEKVGQV